MGVALPLAAEWKTDIEFAKPGGFSLTLDANIPDGTGPFPTVIVVHGGGFIRGDKQTYVKPLFEPLTKAGFTWFTINYRLAPQYPFPAGVEDVEEAVRWVRAHAKEYKVDKNRIALVGESAGGHLVSYAGVKPGKKARVKAVVSFYGPHDLEKRARDAGKLNENIQQFTGVKELNEAGYEKLREESPYHQVKKGLPKFLLIHGTKDEQVPYEQSVRMCEKLKEYKNFCELYTVPEGAHGVGAWEKFPAMQSYKDKMVTWLRAML